MRFVDSRKNFSNFIDVKEFINKTFEINFKDSLDFVNSFKNSNFKEIKLDVGIIL